MNLPVEFLSGADADLQDIFNRFEDYRQGFGAEFVTIVDAYLARIAVFPEIGPIYFEGIRRQVMQRFPRRSLIRVYSCSFVVNPAKRSAERISPLGADLT